MELQNIRKAALRVTHDGTLLFEYVFRPNTPAKETPKPYFHPLQTLGGLALTDFRPSDHPWHHGLTLTCAALSGVNFWGGPTYVAGQGYQDLTDHGRVTHQSWQMIQVAEGEIGWRERLAWWNPQGALWLEEERALTAHLLEALPSAWALDLGFQLKNVSGKTLEWGSPTTQGRPDAGYGGLFWRGSPAMLNGQVWTPNGTGEAALLGQPAPWLAYTGGGATVLFIDTPTNPRHPTQWFVRSREYPGVSAAWMYDRVYTLAAGEVLNLNYRLILADGHLTTEQIQAVVGA